MNEAQETIILIAEYSLGLAGFSGMIAAIQGRVFEWSSLDRFRLANLLLNTFAAGSGAFAALLLLHTLPYDIAVRAACGASAFIQVLSGVINKQLIDSMTDHDREYALASNVLVRISVAMYLIGLIGLLLGVANLFPDYNFSLLLFGLYTLLIGSVMQFVRSIFYGGPSDQRDA